MALDGGGTANPSKPATCGVAVLHGEVVVKAFGMGFFPPAGAHYTSGNFHGYGAEELGLAASLSEFGHHGRPGARDGNPADSYVADFILVVDSMRFADSLIDDSSLSYLTAATRKLVMSQLLQYKEVLILDRDVIPHLSHEYSRSRSGKMGKNWAPDLVGQSTSLTHYMDLTESNKLCAVKMKQFLGVTFLVDTTAFNKHHDWLGGAIVGIYVRGPSRQLDLGHWFQVVEARRLELPITRAVRRCRDLIGEAPMWFFADVAEEIVRSRRVNGETVLRCEDRWPNGLHCKLENVTPGKSCGRKKYGRHGVVWGNIADRFREGTLKEFLPIIWWREDQAVENHISIGPYVAFPRRMGDAATTWHNW